MKYNWILAMASIPARIFGIQRTFRYEVSVCAIFKNEAAYLSEWLTFHHQIGVEHFYLYDDSSEDNFQVILAPWIEAGQVTLTSWNTKNQTAAYNHCIAKNKSKTRWLAFIDIDEFLFCPDSTRLGDRLKNYHGAAAIFVYWVLFGSSGHIEPPKRPVLEAYNRCLSLEDAQNDTFDHVAGGDPAKYVTGWSIDGKSIVNPRRIRKFAIHQPKSIWLGEFVDENYSKPLRRVCNPKMSYSKIRINHYWSKSLEEFDKKVRRGSIANRERPPRDSDRWLAREKQLNASSDTSVLQVTKALSTD